jgi:hypothetical protein
MKCKDDLGWLGDLRDFSLPIILAVILILGGIDEIYKSSVKADGPVPKENYYRGDVVELCIGLKGFIVDKRYNGGYGYGTGWKYEVKLPLTTGTNSGCLKDWVNEIEIEKVIKESPTRPKAEAQ